MIIKNHGVGHPTFYLFPYKEPHCNRACPTTGLSCGSAQPILISYVLQLTEEQLYLHTALFDLGQLHILLLAHH